MEYMQYKGTLKWIIKCLLNGFLVCPYQPESMLCQASTGHSIVGLARSGASGENGSGIDKLQEAMKE
jgi:hypothetical protein